MSLDFSVTYVPGPFNCLMDTFGIHVLFLRARRDSSVSPSKSEIAWVKHKGSVLSNVLTLTTAKRWSLIRLVANGTTPQREHTKNSAVPVANLYFEISASSVMTAFRVASGCEV